MVLIPNNHAVFPYSMGVWGGTLCQSLDVQVTGPPDRVVRMSSVGQVTLDV